MEIQLPAFPLGSLRRQRHLARRHCIGFCLARQRLANPAHPAGSPDAGISTRNERVHSRKENSCVAVGVPVLGVQNRLVPAMIDRKRSSLFLYYVRKLMPQEVHHFSKGMLNAFPRILVDLHDNRSNVKRTKSVILK